MEVDLMPLREDFEVHKVGFILILCALLQKIESASNRALKLGSIFLADRFSRHWERFTTMYEMATDGGDGYLFK
jgi:hypothetical protein